MMVQFLEEWRVVEICNAYEVSNFGSIRRRIAGHAQQAGTVIRPKVDRYGYFAVALFQDGKYIHRQLHRLICEAFHGAPPFPKAVVRHRNGLKLDIRRSNLRWGTTRENVLDSFELMGSGHLPRGSDHHRSELDEETVADMIKRRRAGESNKAIAKSVGVTAATASEAIRGRTWAHVEGR